MKDMTATPATEADAAPAPDIPDRPLRQVLATWTGGASPVSTLSLATDWALHLATAPDKQIALAHAAQAHWFSWLRFVAQGCPQAPEERPISPRRGDRRFDHPAWARPPYAALAQGFLLLEDYVDTATSNVPGLDPARDRAMTFAARQVLDAAAPSNFPATNPVVLRRTVATGGANLRQGAARFIGDLRRLADDAGPAPVLTPGREVACTPGTVVARNDLMELIRYEATTETVRPEPVLFVPAWIMKYYILDLSPQNSMVRWLTAQGFTVYMISWRNPGAGDADLGMEDYRRHGPMAALDAIVAQTGARRMHAAGYCLGGTLLSAAAAAMARDGDDRLASMTLLAAQTDFSEPGELSLFVDESQVSMLEDVMAAQGYLDASQMMSAFQLMRSNDLVWSRMIEGYLLGEDAPPANDLMSWNADTTRMPARMHAEYLRHMFLQNDLASGRYRVDGRPVSLRDIRVPVFAVGTETDHIAPWRSVYKIHGLSHAGVTFALTNGGHNAGVVSEPGHPRRHHRLHHTGDGDAAMGPDAWLEVAAWHEGSWWPSWAAWLAERSGAPVAPPAPAPALAAAPGTYVLEA